MNIKSILTWLVITVVIVGTILGISSVQNGSSEQSSVSGGDGEILAVDEWDQTKWAPVGTATVTLIKYSDFQCPACGSAANTLAGLGDEFADSVTFVYRHFPLRSIHKFAGLAARASEAAGKQGKFWEMHDKIFAGAQTWSKSTSTKDVQEVFAGYAKEIAQLDIAQYEKDIVSDEVFARVKYHEKQSRDLNLTGTPSFFLNGKPFNMPRTVGSLRDALNKVVSESQVQKEAVKSSEM